MNETTSNPLVDAWVAAIGGRDAVGAIRTIHTRARIRGLGLEGTIEEWATADGRHRQKLDLGGVYETLRIYNNRLHTGWLIDQNGKLQVLSGDALSDLITEAFFASYSHLVPGRMTGGVATPSSEHNGKTLQVEPDGGLPVVCRIDPDTQLPSSTQQPYAESVRTTRFEDWRQVDGVLMPFRIYQDTGGPESRMESIIDDIEINSAFDNALFEEPIEAPPDFRFTTGLNTTEIPIDLNWNHVYVSLRINDSGPKWMLLDTGAQISAIDTQCADELGLQSIGEFQGRGAGEGTTTAALTKGVSFRLDGVELLNQTVGIIPLASLISRFTGTPVNGVLGFDFMSRFVVHIDYLGKTMRLVDPKLYRHAGDGDVIPISLNNGIPMVQATITPFGREPIAALFLVDTGASDAVYLATPFVEEHDLLSTLIDTVRMTVPGVGGESLQNVGRIECLQLGESVIEEPVTFLSHDQRGAFANPGFAGVIGAEILRRFDVIFDYSSERMILEPNAAFRQSYEFDKSGLVLQADGPDYRTISVRSIIVRSPAEEAGLRVGDVVREIDGSDASEFTLVEISRLLIGDRADLSLRIQRGEEILDRNLTLRRLV